MKRLLTILLFAILGISTAFAQIFDANAPTGQSLTYRVIEGTNTVGVAAYDRNILGDLTIPSSVTYNGTTYMVTKIDNYNHYDYGYYAFQGCTGLTSVTIPNSVTSIGSSAFIGCTGLTSVTIPNSVTSIGYDAFYGCTGLTSVSIPNSVTSIERAFSGCTGLTSFVVSSGNTHYDSRNNCNAIIETSSNTLIAGCKNTVIPNSVTSIGSAAFYGHTGLTSVTIPNSVTSIGYDAFYGCTGLTSVTIPNSVTSIEYGVFYGCTGLTSVTIGDSVTSIGGRVFYGCTGLTSVTIPNSVTSIGYDAFYGCTGLTSVTIGNSVTCIGEKVFSGCTGLRSITFKSTTPPTISANTFENLSRNTAIIVPCDCQTAYMYAQYYDYFNAITPDCSNNGGGDNGGNGGGNNGSDTTTVTHGDTVYVYVTIHDTIHDTVCPEVNSISPTVISDINIYTIERQIVVEGAASMPVTFYDMQGRTLETKQSRNNQPVRFNAPATGVYMIRVANLPAQRVAILR